MISINRSEGTASMRKMLNEAKSKMPVKTSEKIPGEKYLDRNIFNLIICFSRRPKHRKKPKNFEKPDYKTGFKKNWNQLQRRNK